MSMISADLLALCWVSFTWLPLLSGLLALALYQRRHSDTKAGPGTVFVGFAGLILLNVLGVYWCVALGNIGPTCAPNALFFFLFLIYISMYKFNSFLPPPLPPLLPPQFAVPIITGAQSHFTS